MEKFKKYLWPGLLVIFLLIWWPFKWSPFPRISEWWGTSTEEQTIQVNQRYVDSLRVIIANYELDRNSFDGKTKELSDSLTKLQAQINRDQIRITELKRKTNEKISNVDKLSTIELTKLLSDRYKDSIK